MKITFPALIVAALVAGAPVAFAQNMSTGKTSTSGAAVNKDDQGMSQGMTKKKHASKHKKQKHAKSHMNSMGGTTGSKPMDYSGTTSAPGAGVNKDDSKKK
jgi:hypothetical protein